MGTIPSIARDNDAATRETQMKTVIKQDHSNRPYYEFCHRCDHCKLGDMGLGVEVRCKSKPSMQWINDSDFTSDPTDMILECTNMKRKKFTVKQLTALVEIVRNNA